MEAEIRALLDAANPPLDGLAGDWEDVLHRAGRRARRGGRRLPRLAGTERWRMAAVVVTVLLAIGAASAYTSPGRAAAPASLASVHFR